MAHVLIVGAYGSAGVAVADDLVDAPEVDRLTLVDDGEPGGGLCILRGCMPSKELLSTAAHRYQARHDHRMLGTPEVDLEATVATKDEHVANFAAHRRGAVEMFAEEPHVEFLHDTARFVDDRTVAVGDRTLDPDYVVVATGSTVTVPDLPGLEDVPFDTSRDVLDATAFPDSGVVMGFGTVGLELVPYLSEVGGVDLTVIEHDARPLDRADPAFGDEILSLYREEFGVEIRTHTYEQSVERTGDGGVRLHVEHEGVPDTVEADRLYLFTGRRPNLDRLGLDRTALAPEPGWVRQTMQARDDPRVYVVGDVTGRDAILHVAKEEGFTAAENLRRQIRGEDLRTYEPTDHYVVFAGASVYPYARVGHSAASADAAGLETITATRRAEEDGVFKTKAAAEGLASLVVDRTDGTVLGYQGLHYHADVMAKTMQVIVEAGTDVRDLPDRAYHPTTPEILDGLFRDAAEAVGR